MLLDAFLHKANHELVLKTEGSPLVRLKEYVLQVGRFFTGENGIVVAWLLTAIQDNAVLRKEFMERVYSPRDTEFRAIVKEAIRKRQLPADTDVSMFLDTVVGPLFTRLLIRHEQIDEAFVVSVFDRVVAGAIAQDAAAATPKFKPRAQKHPPGAKQAAEKLRIPGEIGLKPPSAAKAAVDSVGLLRGLKPLPPSGLSFSAACKAHADFREFAARDPTQRAPRRPAVPFQSGQY